MMARLAARWDAETARALGDLARRVPAEGPDAPPAFDPARLGGLPGPVRRYFAFALRPGHPAVRYARVEHEGHLAVRPGRWRPFTSVQHFTTEPPGFVWDARVRVAPLATVRVRGALVDGAASVRAAVAGLVSVVDQPATPELAASALWRYLAEAAWFPTALLPSARLAWAPVDDATARATLTHGGAAAVADFHFGAGGEIERVTGTRHRAVGSAQEPTPTVGWHRGWRRVAGMMVPTEGELAWLLPEGPHAYWRARVVRAVYGPGAAPG